MINTKRSNFEMKIIYLMIALIGFATHAETLDELVNKFEIRETEAVNTVKKQFVAELSKYATERKDAEDHERAFIKLLELKYEIDDYSDFFDIAKEYHQQYSEGEEVIKVMLLEFAVAQTKPEYLDHGISIFNKIVSSDDLEDMDSARLHLGLAETLVKYDRISQAMKIYISLLGLEPIASDPDHTAIVRKRLAKLTEIGIVFEPFEATDIDNNERSSNDYKGKVVLVDFWATWCGPCLTEIPTLKKVYDQYHKSGFEILGISLDDNLEKMRKFIDSKDMKWPQFADGKGWENELAQKYSVTSIPTSYLLNRDGTIYRQDLRGEELENAVSKLTAKEVPN